MTREREQLRERVRAAIFDTAKVGRGTTDNGLRLCGEVADAVLDALGLVQVGWQNPHPHLGHEWVPSNRYYDDQAVSKGWLPVYRLREGE